MRSLKVFDADVAGSTLWWRDEGPGKVTRGRPAGGPMS